MAISGFKDHFSGHARSYERYRPGYPRELFEWLAAQSPARSLAVDVATGNGQAAIGLAEFFDAVIATEASAAQLEQAEPRPRVSYRCEPAERMSLPAAAADLVVAAQAAHWFEWGAFVEEARRVLRPGGVLAVWCYGRFVVAPAIDWLMDDFARALVGPYWPRERRHVDTGYRDLVLSFAEFTAPHFEMRADWDCEAALGYLGTWTAVQRCRALSGRDPLRLLEPLLADAWGEDTRVVRWPLSIKAGRA